MISPTTPFCNIKALNSNSTNAHITHVVKQHQARSGGFWALNTDAQLFIALPQQQSEATTNKDTVTEDA
jgi:hypothetical protein